MNNKITKILFLNSFTFALIITLTLIVELCGFYIFNNLLNNLNNINIYVISMWLIFFTCFLLNSFIIFICLKGFYVKYASNSENVISTAKANTLLQNSTIDGIPQENIILEDTNKIYTNVNSPTDSPIIKLKHKKKRAIKI